LSSGRPRALISSAASSNLKAQHLPRRGCIEAVPKFERVRPAPTGEGEPRGPPGRWISAGWCGVPNSAPPRRAPHHSGEGPWPNQCARVFSCAGRDLAPSLVGRRGNCISLQGRRIGSDSGPLGGATRCAIARSTSIASAANDATGRITIPLMTFRCTPSSLRH
jgi:hypothetical protein